MSQKIDLSGVERFWSMVSTFDDGEEPSEEEWERLFETPGYRILTAVEFSREFFIEKFKKAFTGEGEDDFVEHFREVVSKRDELNRYLSKIYEEDYYDEAVEYALGWLPFDEVEMYPPVSFLFFSRDARGYVPIVFDLLLAYELGEEMPLFLGHEMHHFYRNLEVSFSPDIEDREIIWVLNQIHMEGLADHVNEELIFGGSVMGDEWSERYKEVYENAEDYIADLDELMKGYGEDRSVGEEMQESLPLSGHPVGYYMAEKIIDAGMKVELLDSYDDPFHFFELYAESGGEFSEKSLDVVRELKEKYSPSVHE